MSGTYRNASGCADPTASKAIENVSREKQKANELIRTLKYIAKIAGFEFDGEIAVRDRETGVVWNEKIQSSY